MRVPLHLDVKLGDLSWVPGTDRVVTASASGVLATWSVSTGRLLVERQVTPKEVFILQVFADGVRLAIIDTSALTTIWNSISGATLQRFQLPQLHKFIGVLGQRDEIVTGCSGIPGDPAIVWDTGSGAVARLLRHPDTDDGSPEFAILRMALSLDGSRLVTAGMRRAFVWDIVAGLVERALVLPAAAPSVVTTSLAGHVVAACHAAGSRQSQRAVSIWRDGSTPSRVVVMNESVWSCVALGNGDEILAFMTTWAAVLDGDSGETLRVLEGGIPGDAQSLSFSTGDSFVAACGIPLLGQPLLQEVVPVWTRVWDVATGRLLHDEQELDAQVVERGKAQRPCSVTVSEAGSMADWFWHRTS